MPKSATLNLGRAGTISGLLGNKKANHVERLKEFKSGMAQLRDPSKFFSYQENKDQIKTLIKWYDKMNTDAYQRNFGLEDNFKEFLKGDSEDIHYLASLHDTKQGTQVLVPSHPVVNMQREQDFKEFMSNIKNLDTNDFWNNSPTHNQMKKHVQWYEGQVKAGRITLHEIDKTDISYLKTLISDLSNHPQQSPPPSPRSSPGPSEASSSEELTDREKIEKVMTNFRNNSAGKFTFDLYRDPIHRMIARYDALPNTDPLKSEYADDIQYLRATVYQARGVIFLPSTAANLIRENMQGLREQTPEAFAKMRELIIQEINEFRVRFRASGQADQLLRELPRYNAGIQVSRASEDLGPSHGLGEDPDASQASPGINYSQLPPSPVVGSEGSQFGKESRGDQVKKDLRQLAETQQQAGRPPTERVQYGRLLPKVEQQTPAPRSLAEQAAAKGAQAKQAAAPPVPPRKGPPRSRIGPVPTESRRHLFEEVEDKAKEFLQSSGPLVQPPKSPVERLNHLNQRLDSLIQQATMNYSMGNNKALSSLVQDMKGVHAEASQLANSHHRESAGQDFEKLDKRYGKLMKDLGEGKGHQQPPPTPRSFKP